MEGSRPEIFELRRLADSSDETLIEELRRVALLAPEGPLTVAIFREHGYGEKRIRKRFGTWQSALRAAGLLQRSSGAVGFQGSHASLKMSDERVLEELRLLAKKLDKSELTVADVRQHLPFGQETLAKRWGSSHAAFKAAGLECSIHGRRHTTRSCFTNLLAVWTHYGRPPKYAEMSLPPSQVGGKAYMHRFGTWNKALFAFAEWVSGNEPVQERDEEVEKESAPSQVEASIRIFTKVGEDAREIPLGLRFRVLQRDRFRCVLCGDHPARNAECRLHVDHILPWSKGGKTREDNLRALCENCNVGRGNRFLSDAEVI